MVSHSLSLLYRTGRENEMGKFVGGETGRDITYQ